MILTFVIAALVGFAVGVFSGLLGIGGGSITIPLFRLVMGMSPVVSTATSLFAIIPTSFSGAIQHIRKKTCVVNLGIALGIGGACCSPLGVWFAQGVPGWLVMLGAALAICSAAFTMLRKALGTKRDDEATAAFFQLSSFDFLKAVFIGAVVGVVSGFVGLGGGFLMIPLMVSVLKLPMKLASGTSLIAVMILVIPATVMQCMLGNVNYLIGIAIAFGSIPGALVGSNLVSRISEQALRVLFAVFLGLAALLLVVREFGLWGE